MPTYRFICPACGLTMDKQLKILESDDPKSPNWPKCECGRKMQKAWISPEGGFILKGPGWFKKGGY